MKIATEEISNSVNDIEQGVMQQAIDAESCLHQMSDRADKINVVYNNTNSIASIEAARAGHAGLGFSVVAEEIRKLADQSMAASDEIGHIIKRINDQTKKTVKTAKSAESIVLSQEDVLNNTIEVFNNINQHVEKLSDNLDQIAGGIEQAKDDTLRAIESISATAEESSAAASQLGTTAENQLSEVNRLNDVVQQLHDDSVNLENTIQIFKIQ